MPAFHHSPEQLQQGKRYEACFRAYGRGLAIQAGGNVLKEGGVEVYASPTQNVFNAHLPRPCPAYRTREVFHTTLRLGEQQPSGLGILVGPSARQEEWAALLKEQGIRCGYWVPFMHRDLAIPIAKSPVINRIHITTLSEISVFWEHPHPYIGKPTTPQRQAEITYGGELVKKGRAQQLVAFEGEKPVGFALIFLHRRAAAVYNVGVLEAYRKRGIGRNLMLASLREARRMGADCAVLSAASKAVPVYERVGFTSAGHYGSYYIGRTRLERIVHELD